MKIIYHGDLCLCQIPVNHTLKCLNIGTPKTIDFPFGSKWKINVFLDIPIHKHIMVYENHHHGRSNPGFEIFFILFSYMGIA